MSVSTLPPTSNLPDWFLELLKTFRDREVLFFLRELAMILIRIAKGG